MLVAWRPACGASGKGLVLFIVVVDVVESEGLAGPRRAATGVCGKAPTADASLIASRAQEELLVKGIRER